MRQSWCHHRHWHHHTDVRREQRWRSPPDIRAFLWVAFGACTLNEQTLAQKLTLNTSGCETGWTYSGASGWYGCKLPHPPYCKEDIRAGGNNYAKGAMTAVHPLSKTGEIQKVTFSYRYSCGYCENKDYEDPPRIFFEFVSNPTHPFDQAGSVVESVTVQQCDVYCYDNGTYSPVIFVASTVSIQATEPMYFRVRTIGGKGHNLQIPLYSTSGPEAADQGGLTDVVVTMGAMPMSTGTIIIIVFFAGIVIPYVVLGTVYRAYVLKQTGWDVLPNREFWASVRENIGLGCAVTFRKAKSATTHLSASAGYESL